MQAKAQVAATKFVFSSGAPQTLTVNVVSAGIVVQRQTASGTPVSSGASAVTVALSSSGTGVFYSNAAGTHVITSIVIVAGQSSSVNFYYKATVVGHSSHTLTGASGNLIPATSSFTISAPVSTPTPTKTPSSSPSPTPNCSRNRFNLHGNSHQTFETKAR